MSREMRACIECHALFNRRSGRIRCALCAHVHELEHYRSTVGKLYPEDRGLYEAESEIKAVAERQQAAALWSERMKFARWDVRRREGEG
jgi:hypothetical protein